MKRGSQSGAPRDAALAQAIDGLWARFLPEIGERVTILEVAAEAAGGGKLTEKQREAAQAAAHKLAGVLGTFGLTRGTELARELELLFTHESSRGTDTDPRVAEIPAELRAMVESRKSSA